MAGGDLVPMFGRRSHGMDPADWIQLASAYEDWNDFIDTGNTDFAERAHLIFSNYNLWDYTSNEPMLDKYRQLIMERC